MTPEGTQYRARLVNCPGQERVNRTYKLLVMDLSKMAHPGPSWVVIWLRKRVMEGLVQSLGNKNQKQLKSLSSDQRTIQFWSEMQVSEGVSGRFNSRLSSMVMYRQCKSEIISVIFPFWKLVPVSCALKKIAKLSQWSQRKLASMAIWWNHQILGRGSTGGMAALKGLADILKPALSRGELTVIRGYYLGWVP